MQCISSLPSLYPDSAIKYVQKPSSPLHTQICRTHKPVFICTDLQLKFYANKDRKAQGKLPPPRRCSTETELSGGCLLSPKPPPVPRTCVLTNNISACPSQSRACNRLQAREVVTTGAGRLPGLPPAEVEEEG